MGFSTSTYNCYNSGHNWAQFGAHIYGQQKILQDEHHAPVPSGLGAAPHHPGAGTPGSGPLQPLGPGAVATPCWWAENQGISHWKRWVFPCFSRTFWDDFRDWHIIFGLWLRVSCPNPRHFNLPVTRCEKLWHVGILPPTKWYFDVFHDPTKRYFIPKNGLADDLLRFEMTKCRMHKWHKNAAVRALITLFSYPTWIIFINDIKLHYITGVWL